MTWVSQFAAPRDGEVSFYIYIYIPGYQAWVVPPSPMGVPGPFGGARELVSRGQGAPRRANRAPGGPLDGPKRLRDSPGALQDCPKRP